MKEKKVKWIKSKLKKVKRLKDNDHVAGDKYILSMDHVEDGINIEKVPKHVQSTLIMHLDEKDVPQLINTKSLV